MTPKEKAQDLVDKFYHHGMATITTKRQAHNDAKQCALIAIEEIIKSNPAQFILVDNVSDPLKPRYEYISNKDYWQEVKNEIENL